MALTLVVETGEGLPNSNSYCSVVYADTYMDGSLYAATWIAATTQNKEKALVSATRMLDSRIRWKGRKTRRENALEWPRYCSFDRNGYWIPSDEIPDWLLAATAELALQFLSTNPNAEPATKGITSVKVDTIAVSFDKADRPSAIQSNILSLISPYGTYMSSAVGIVGRA